ncbi:MAG: group II intron reverse transcriptase/maturase [Gammaproteobacteria bacterium]|nr:group II intron reverse transcriptase/maturase [Gammaproteobacteria bacterium]NIR69301.1 group II intron reverse transcriptase/maturase [candidate division KSB1 bacterium]
MRRILDRDNLFRALDQVRRNQGSPGVDGMTVEQLPVYLKHHWPHIREQLVEGSYRPQPIKRVMIPKPNGDKRPLGIPTVLDRLIQQAIAQVLSETWEPKFHPHSFGFRPGKSAHQALLTMQHFVREEHTIVVDMDLKAFFDEVNHDRLMVKLKRAHPDGDVLRLINRYLKAPVEYQGGRIKPSQGVPQGGPLSPLLANIVLNELDWELNQRGHKFVRYADDFQVYVKSHRAGHRIIASLGHFIEKRLRLKVNLEKSAVDLVWNRPFLGFTLSSRGKRLKVSEKSLKRLKAKIRTLTRRTRGHSIPQILSDLRQYLLGWKAYFDIAEVVSPLKDLDKWIRRKLRCYIWKQWGRSGYRQLRRLGIDRQLAWNTAKSAHGPWRLSKSPALYKALPNRYFADLGLPQLAARV